MIKNLLACIFVSLLVVAPAKAAQDFQTHLQLTFTFAADGTSKVTQKYTLTNLTSESAASSYEFEVVDSLPTNMVAYDRFGKLELKTVATDHTTRYVIPFKHPAAGKGKSTDFFITYTGPSVFLVDGLRKISLPLPSLPDPADELTAQLELPLDFGHALTLSPKSVAVSTSDQSQIFKFSSSDLKSGSLYGIFGKKQLSGFTLTYTAADLPTGIELPSDQPGQNIFLTSIHPQPVNVVSTPDGRWVATFPRLTDSVVVSGYALVVDRQQLLLPSGPQVTVSNLDVLPEGPPAALQIDWKRPLQILPLFTPASRLLIFNPGPQAVYHLPVTISSNSLTLSSPVQSTIPVVPPFGSVSLPLILSLPLIPPSDSTQLTVSAAGKSLTYNIESGYFLLWYVCTIIVITSAFLAVGRLTGYAWRVHFQIRRRAGALRRQSQKP